MRLVRAKVLRQGTEVRTHLAVPMKIHTRSVSTCVEEPACDAGKPGTTWILKSFSGKEKSINCEECRSLI
jgi:hypothetical protein